MDDWLAEALRCPDCRGPVSASGAGLTCESCHRNFATATNVPTLLPTVRAPDAWKDAQASYFDATADSEWEITRPHGAPRFHRWVLEQKFARSIKGLPFDLAGRRVLVVCGGSGLDAEFLDRLGARVVVSDLSLGAMQRALERAQRNGLQFTACVADVEHLPFSDGSFDLVYVHDGLHHLADPSVGLREMTRVARAGISLTEPCRAFATTVATRLGIAESIEEAGNDVMRLTVTDVVRTLEQEQLRVTTAERYGLFYRHEPGAPSRVLSTEPAFWIATKSIDAANGIFGKRIGNKLTVQAVAS
jgi:SAM-dependent methyltransferase